MLAVDLLVLLLGSLHFGQGSAIPGKRQLREYSPAIEEWDKAEDRAAEFVSQLNLTEKVTMVTGTLLDVGTGCIGRIRPVQRLGFPGLCLLDGPNAVNRAHLVSIFPSGISVAASWDRELMYDRGLALGREFKAKGAHVILGPTTGPLGRHPMGGRNWEGFSPDPFLSGEAVKYTVMGHQAAGVQTSTKHYIGNEQETMRSDTTMKDGTIVDAVSSNIDDRALHELYLWPFADALKAGTTSIMCSYNRLNNTYACEHPRLLTGILREQLGFRGFVISDWFATHSTSKAANAGLDMEQPGELPPGVTTSHGGGGYFGLTLEKAVQAGNVTERRIDEMVRRLMTPYLLLHQDSPDYPTVDPSMPYLLGISNSGWESRSLAGLGEPVPGRDVRENHHELIRKWGASATVLLKNNGTLPFGGKSSCAQKPIHNIGVFGNAAVDPAEGLVFPPNSPPEGPEYGFLSIGGGAGSGRNSYVVSPLDAIKDKAKESDAIVQYIASNDVLARNDFRSVFPKPDICLVFLKTWAAETYDRTSFELSWNSTVVVNNVAKFCGRHKTVVVTNSAGVNTMPWANNVTAILAGHYGGQEWGNSLVDVLWGKTEPSGRLPYTIPKAAADYDLPVVNLTGPDGLVERDSSKWQADFTEGQLIDYRHFDAKEIEPLYEFGFGLGYTTFEVDTRIDLAKLYSSAPSDLPDGEAKIKPGGNVDLWTELLRVTATVRNTGKREGSTVVQLYMSFPDSDNMKEAPVRVLRGFEKVKLGQGESQRVEMVLK
ncbi:Beta-glucosidase [Fusarium falciforme]|uniref:Beta-glucosidase n=1 Tax=Fusarium falciforme TaxID=195108 RepID=UPI002300B6EF|nr:Beta-glucosidase [Fusarium falciforme]WAO95964.1 Beta-glucosidase [Fusarium falciforme]